MVNEIKQMETTVKVKFTSLRPVCHGRAKPSGREERAQQGFLAVNLAAADVVSLS